MSEVLEAISLASLGFIFLVIFIVLSAPMGTIFDFLEDSADEAGYGDEVRAHTEGDGGLRWLFGFLFVLFEIAAVIRAYVAANSETYEEFSNDENYYRR